MRQLRNNKLLRILQNKTTTTNQSCIVCKPRKQKICKFQETANFAIVADSTPQTISKCLQKRNVTKFAFLLFSVVLRFCSSQVPKRAADKQHFHKEHFHKTTWLSIMPDAHAFSMHTRSIPQKRAQ